MARPASGIDCIADARAFRDNAKTAEDLRLALAVLLPLEQGLRLKLSLKYQILNINYLIIVYLIIELIIIMSG